VGSKAPSDSTDEPGSLPATCVQRYGALACVSIALLASTPTAATAAQLEPDPAPAAPTITPDPAPASPAEPVPGTSPTEPAPPQQGTFTPYVQPEPAAPPPAEPQSTPQTPPAPTPRPEATAAAKSKAERGGREAPEQRNERKAKETSAPANPGSLVRVGALLPGSEPPDNSHRLFLLAAGALLALLMASGSLISVASRVMRGQPR
jgi:outer membrane biosynthesis protein TonB